MVLIFVLNLGNFCYFRIYMPSNWIVIDDSLLTKFSLPKEIAPPPSPHPSPWVSRSLKEVILFGYLLGYIYFTTSQCCGEGNCGIFLKVTTAAFEVLYALSESSHSPWRGGVYMCFPWTFQAHDSSDQDVIWLPNSEGHSYCLRSLSACYEAAQKTWRGHM